MNKELIKKLCEMTEGWMFVTGNTEHYHYLKYDEYKTELGSSDWFKIFYPLLLSQACDELGIIIYGDDVGGWYAGTYCDGLNQLIYKTKTANEARTAALEEYFNERD